MGCRVNGVVTVISPVSCWEISEGSRVDLSPIGTIDEYLPAARTNFPLKIFMKHVFQI